MRFKEIVNELRKNPKQNPKRYVEDVLIDRIRNENTQVYISFTDIEKLAINPINDYYTPHGIYAYLGEYVLEDDDGFDGDNNLLPYAGHREWANIFTAPDANILRLEGTDHAEFETTIQGAYEAFTRLWQKKYPGKEPEVNLDNFIKNAKAGNRDWLPSGEAKTIYRVFKYLANILVGYKHPEDVISRPGVLWTKLFVEAGWDAIYLNLKGTEEVYDAGDYEQICFFSRSKFKNIDRIKNSGSRESAADEKKWGDNIARFIQQFSNATTKEQKEMLNREGYGMLQYIRNPSEEIQRYANDKKEEKAREKQEIRDKEKAADELEQAAIKAYYDNRNFGTPIPDKLQAEIDRLLEKK